MLQTRTVESGTLELLKFKMHEVFHIVKSLTYFEDAEQSANPVVFDKSVTCQKVKDSINGAVKKLG